MNVLDNSYNNIANADRKIWCDEDRHTLFEFFADFNDWIDGNDGQDIRDKYGLNGLSQPSKAFYAGDAEAYKQEFKNFQQEQVYEILGADYIQAHFNDDHWFQRNQERFEQLEECLISGNVVPFVGAGLSVEGGFPSWQAHLRQQGRTSGIEAVHIETLLEDGQYEQVIVEIEEKGYKDAFIQEIRDVFSKRGKITDTTLRLTELFTDTIITTNYDRLIEQAFDTGNKNKIQLIDSSNINELPDQNKTTVIKLHGDISKPAQCILGKNQYDEAYGNEILDLSKPIPKLLSYHYRTSNLLFLGCSLNHDRTMQVFQAVKDQLGDVDRQQHFSLESTPETEEELSRRNAYLLSFGITPIWFPKGSYNYIEQILRLARNEMRYRGNELGVKKENTLLQAERSTIVSLVNKLSISKAVEIKKHSIFTKIIQAWQILTT